MCSACLELERLPQDDFAHLVRVPGIREVVEGSLLGPEVDSRRPGTGCQAQVLTCY